MTATLTERLELRPWCHAEVADNFAAVNAQPAVTEFLNGGRPQPRVASDALSRRIAAHWEEHGFGPWALFSRAGGPLLGFVGLMYPAWLPSHAHRVEVGWRLDPAAWGRGYATEAGRAALELGFGRLRLPEVISLIDPRNRRSVAVAERLSLARERVIRHPAGDRDIAVYRLGRTAPDDV